jgi:sulfite reductase (NADPH) hemoprotein beta-component
MNKLYAQDVGKARIVELVEPLLIRYAKERRDGEHFGDFVIRTGVVKPTRGGNTFHDDVTLV